MTTLDQHREFNLLKEIGVSGGSDMVVGFPGASVASPIWEASAKVGGGYDSIGEFSAHRVSSTHHEFSFSFQVTFTFFSIILLLTTTHLSSYFLCTVRLLDKC